jgi:hypothetical protein
LSFMCWSMILSTNDVLTGVGSGRGWSEVIDPFIGSVSLSGLLTSAQKNVPGGVVIALVDACRTEAGLAVTSVAGREDSRCRHCLTLHTTPCKCTISMSVPAITVCLGT